VNPFFRPLHVEVTRECDGVVFVIDSQHLVNVNGDGDVIDALFHRELKFGIIFRQTGQLVATRITPGSQFQQPMLSWQKLDHLRKIIFN